MEIGHLLYFCWQQTDVICFAAIRALMPCLAFRKLRSSRQGVFSGSAWLVASMQLAYAGTGQKQSVREFLFPLLIASYR